MSERELMLAVVEAARAVLVRWDKMGAHRVLESRIAALDAHTPEPEGEMVTMALIRSPKSGRFAGTMEPDQEDPRDWEHVGNIVFRAPARVVLPTVAATIAPLEGKPHD